MKKSGSSGPAVAYLHSLELPGKLVVLEGPDSVGRSTHVKLLKWWLECRGHAVTVTGLTRSALAGEGLSRAKEGHTMGVMTYDLFYATDFADLFENSMIPALRAGNVVLADRYIYTNLARAEVRDTDPQYIRDVYRFAIRPDVVIHLKASPRVLAHRGLRTGGLEYWESGMDLRLADNVYDNFLRYQELLGKKFDQLAQEFGFHTVNAEGEIDKVQQAVRDVVGNFL